MPSRSLLCPSSNTFKINLKKEGKVVFFTYVFLRSIKKVMRPTSMIAINKPAIAGTKYRSAIDGVVAGSDVAVGYCWVNYKRRHRTR